MIVPTSVNGKVPSAFLAALPGANGDGSPHTADRLAVSSYERLRRDLAAAGHGDLVPSPGWSCYRSLAAQALMRAQGLTTLPPGRSIHGEALGVAAVDFLDMAGSRLSWMRKNAGRYGWTQPAWAVNGLPSIGQKPEPWHWEYTSTQDTQPGPPPAPEKPTTTPQPEDEDMPTLVAIYFDKGSATEPGYGSTGIYNDATGFRETSHGTEARYVLDSYVSAANALGFRIVTRSVDAVGWADAHQLAVTP